MDTPQKPVSRPRLSLLTALLAGVLLVGCAGGEQPEAEPDGPEAALEQPDEAEAPIAVADLQPTQGNDVQGQVTFTRQGDGQMRVRATVTNLPEGEHGFHIHENGDCSAPDASSAGGHYAPDGSPHGRPTDPPGQRHTGDMGNLEAGADGRATYERTFDLLAFDGTHNIVDRAVIIHAQPDRFTQPSGDAGDRLACGVIKMQEGGMNAGRDTTAAR